MQITSASEDIDLISKRLAGNACPFRIRCGLTTRCASQSIALP
jgi:hypothetical protein